jgi:hypothetical protein
MNTQNTNPGAARARRKAVIAALLVALLGLTILPGFTCTQENNADGSSKTTFQSE